MKRIIAILMSALMAASVFTACGNSKTAGTDAKSGAPSAAPAGKKVTLDVVTSYGGDDGNRKNYETAFKSWEQKTGNKIKDSSGIGNEDWKIKVMNSFEVGSEPDVLFFFNGADSNKLVKNHKVISIDEIRKEYPDYAKNMREDMLGASPVDGKNYSVPVNGYWESMFVNTKVLKDCGITVPVTGYTYDQFLKDCETIKNKGYTPIAASLAEVPNYWFEFLAYNYMSAKDFNTMPKSVSDSSGKAWINGMKDMKVLFEKGYFPKNTNSTTDADTNNLMSQNKAAFMIDGSWKVGWFEENMKEDMDGDGKPDIENIDVAFPPVKGSTRLTTDYIGGISMGYFITAKAWNDPDKREACVDFISHMTEDDVVSTFCSAGSISALKNGVTAPSTASPLVKKVNEMNKKVTGISAAVEDLMDNKSVRTPFFADVKNMVTGKLDITKAVGDVIAAQEAFVEQTSSKAS